MIDKNIVIVIAIFSSFAVIQCNQLGPRKIKPWKGTGGSVCQEQCLSHIQVQTVAFSPIKEVMVTENDILVCTPGSHFQKVSYKGIMKSNVTCSGVITQTGVDMFDYTGTKKDPVTGGPVDVSLRSHNTRFIASFNNGNEQFMEWTNITGGECAGHVLTSYSSWVADHPLDGCCNGMGVKTASAVYYKLIIRANVGMTPKCCSECYLLSGSISYDMPITN